MPATKSAPTPRDSDFEGYSLKPVTPNRAPVYIPCPTYEPGISNSEPDAPPKASRIALLMVGLLVGGAAGLFVLSSRADFQLGQLAAALWLVPALHGTWRGGFRKLSMLVTVSGLGYLMYACGGVMDPLLYRVLGSFGTVGNLIAKGAVVGGLVVLMSMFVKSVRKHWISKSPGLNVLDRMLGMGVGLAEGTVALLILCWTATMTMPYAMILRDREADRPDSAQHRFAGALLDLADEAQSGPIADAVAKADIINNIPMLRDAMQQLNAKGEFSLNGLGPSGGAGDDPSLLSSGIGLDTLQQAKSIAEQYGKTAQQQADAVERLRKAQPR